MAKKMKPAVKAYFSAKEVFPDFFGKFTPVCFSSDHLVNAMSEHERLAPAVSDTNQMISLWEFSFSRTGACVQARSLFRDAEGNPLCTVTPGAREGDYIIRSGDRAELVISSWEDSRGAAGKMLSDTIIGMTDRKKEIIWPHEDVFPRRVGVLKKVWQKIYKKMDAYHSDFLLIDLPSLLSAPYGHTALLEVKSNGCGTWLHEKPWGDRAPDSDTRALALFKFESEHAGVTWIDPLKMDREHLLRLLPKKRELPPPVSEIMHRSVLTKIFSADSIRGGVYVGPGEEGRHIWTQPFACFSQGYKVSAGQFFMEGSLEECERAFPFGSSLVEKTSFLSGPTLTRDQALKQARAGLPCLPGIGQGEDFRIVKKEGDTFVSTDMHGCSYSFDNGKWTEDEDGAAPAPGA